MLIRRRNVGWVQCMSVGSLGLSLGVGQSFCSWLVAVVDLFGGDRVL